MPTPPALPPAFHRSMTPPVAEAPGSAYPTVTGPATVEVTINGVLYRFSGWATFSGGLWAPAGAGWSGKWALVQPTPPVALADPQISGYTAPDGSPIGWPWAGKPLAIHGMNFGSVPGTLRMDFGTVPFSRWTDTEIDTTYPAGLTHDSAVWTVTRPDGAYYSGAVWALQPPANPPGAIGSPYYREPDDPAANGARARRSPGTGKSVIHAPPRPFLPTQPAAASRRQR